MSVYAGPEIVSDGLINLYDAANAKSYNSSNTTQWIDILGNGTNFTIYGSPTYDVNGFFTFSTNQTTQYMMAENFPFTTNDHTMIYWFRPTNMGTAGSTDQTPVTYAISTDTNYMLMLSVSGGTTFRVYRSTLHDLTAPNMSNKWNMFTRTRIRSSGVENYYMDGQFVGTRTIDVNGASVSGGKLIIGQEMDNYTTNSFDSNQNLDGSFSFFSMYNRALTNDEILQNYNALRGRYGL